MTPAKADARIMVVDDDPSLLRFTCKYLSRLGYPVSPYLSSEEAWKDFETPGAGYSLAVIDLAMPVISGDQLLRMMLNARPKIRVVLASGYPFDTQSLLDLAPGRIAFLHKPFTPAMLAETVGRLFGAHPSGDAD